MERPLEVHNSIFKLLIGIQLKTSRKCRKQLQLDPTVIDISAYLDEMVYTIFVCIYAHIQTYISINTVTFFKIYAVA